MPFSYLYLPADFHASRGKYTENHCFVSLLLATGMYNDINSSFRKKKEKVNQMVFSVVNKDSRNRRILTDLLLSQYPGCVVYELEALMDVESCLREHTVDAVLWELTANDFHELSRLNTLRTLHQGTHYLICADDDTLFDEAMWNGASMYFIKPVLPEQIAAVLETNKRV